MIYNDMIQLWHNSVNKSLDNPHFVLGVNKAKELRQHCEQSIGRPLPRGLSLFGNWHIIVDSNESPDTCMVDRSDFPVDSYWEE